MPGLGANYRKLITTQLPLYSLIIVATLALGLAVPFIVDTVTFGAAAALVSLISVTAPLRQSQSADGEQPSWTDDIREGFTWLWKHELFRTFAIVLGFYNALMMMTGAVLILFAQEVLETSSVEFDLWLDREMALRATWFLAGGLTLLLALYRSRHFSTAQLEAADPTYESVTL